ncbi:class F sortase [Microbispora bryophytorum]|uniref:Class F sortase n=1 Tax=Microbispora bryophytorum subsp. camponoti TaxID=1677852 RepID=A0ABR8LBS6_9ACTN|nr:class F sortase [Microbispora camponoti]MBD3147701.1 class F sortase [Microbispora camponoti]
MNDAPDGGVPEQGDAGTEAKKTRKPLPQPVLATLLVAGSFGGIAAVMAGMLVVLSPSDPPESGPVAGAVNVQDAGNVALLPPTVGPGGPGVPLTAADLAAPPPSPVMQPIAPLTLTSAASSSSKPLSSGATKTTTKKVTGRPLKISIPAIGVKAAVGSVGVDKSGVIQTPPLSKPSLTGWYRYGPAPGDQGPSIILGHVNTRKGAAVFSRLRELKRGNKIAVLRADGKMAIFTVDGIEQVSKSTFPTKRVYSNTITSSLRLITCGGVYNAKQHHYTDNIIVYATLTETKGK